MFGLFTLYFIATIIMVIVQTVGIKFFVTSNALWKLNSGVWTTQSISVQDLVVVLVMDHNA